MALSLLKFLRRCAATLAILSLLPMTVPRAEAASRIKDIADFEGVRDNVLIGYGLVVGLNGTGDTLLNAEFTRQSLIGMLERLGVNTRPSLSGSTNPTGGTDTLKPKDVAAVIVTATLPAYTRQGARIDVTVSSLGDSTSLLGGTLLVTPLLGADGEAYAVAQGQVSSGYSAGGAATTVTKGVPTSGRIAAGGVVEREVAADIEKMESVQVMLRNPDLTTARRIAQAINAYLGTESARPTDPGTVRLAVPARFHGDTVALLTDIEQLRVQPDQMAKVVIDDRTGTIVMGENVRISTVAIAQGNLTIRITETPQVSQPTPFSSGGTTTTVNRTDVQVDEGADKKFAVLPAGITLQELVSGLNALGIGPRDLITILQAIKAAGALQAEIEVM
jgi:flagellar P-ring protein precursor FlgI